MNKSKHKRKKRLKNYAQTWSSGRVDRGRAFTFEEFTAIMACIDYEPTDRWQWYSVERSLIAGLEYCLHQHLYRPDGKGKQRHVFRIPRADEDLRLKVETVLRMLPAFEKGGSG